MLFSLSFNRAEA